MTKQRVSKHKHNPEIAVGYIRASKDSQKLTPEVQRQAIADWAAREGITVVSWHVDQGVCAVTPIEGRPGLVAAIADLKKHSAGVLIVAKRDRIARRPALTETIELAAAACGARVLSADGASSATGVAGVMLRGMHDLFAEVEREMIRSRTKAALDSKASRGERIGHIPYGKSLAEDGVHLVDNPEEMATIKRAAELSEGLSMGKLAAALTKEGFLSRKGAPFVPMQVYRMLERA